MCILWISIYHKLCGFTTEFALIIEILGGLFWVCDRADVDKVGHQFLVCGQ